MNLEGLLAALSRLISGARAKRIVSDIARFHRIQGSPGYDDALDYVRGLLQDAGIETGVDRFPADGKARTYEWTAPPAWTIRSGRLIQVEPDEKQLVSFDEVSQAIIAHSPGGRFEGELVHVGRGDRPADYEGVKVKGRFVLASGRAGEVEKQVRRRGGVGFIIYPDAERASASYDLIQYQGIFPKAEDVPSLVSGFSISRRIADRLISRMRKGPVRLRGEIDAEFTDRELSVLEARVNGTDPGAGEVLLVAHICHPRQSANDNSSGSAALVEIALALERLRKEIALQNTVRFLWVPEFYGTLPWAAAHAEELKNVHYVLNLDMVGQSPERIGSPLRIFRVPNDLPIYLNAMFKPIATRVAGMEECIAPGGSRRPLHFVVDRPSGGSDHLVFAAPPHRLPAVMFGHDDPYWHSDLDSVENVDPTRMKHVMMIAATLALLPTLAGEEGDLLCEWALAYSVGELLRASGLARRLDPGEGRRLLAISLNIEEERLESLGRIVPDISEFVGFSARLLRQIADHSISPLSERGAGGTEAPSLRPRRLIDGPLLYAVTDRFDDEEKAFFKERLSASHRALVEGLLNLCDGSRTAEEIALQLSLDLGRIVPTSDIERGIELLEKAGYVAT